MYLMLPFWYLEILAFSPDSLLFQILLHKLQGSSSWNGGGLNFIYLFKFLKES